MIVVMALMSVASGTMAQSRQDKYIKSHVGVGLRGGIGRMLTLPTSETTVGMTLGVDAEYTYLLSEHFGVKAGIGVSHTRSSFDMDELISEPTKLTTVTTSGGEEQIMAKYRCVTINAVERYAMTYVDIPVMVMIQGTPMDFTIKRFHSCYFAVGAKVSLPLSCTANTEYSTTKVYVGPSIPGSGVVLDEMLQVENYEPERQSYNISDAGNPLYVMLALEGGVTLKLNDAGELLFALYGDYAINHSTTNNPVDASAIASNGDQFTTNGYLKSNNVDRFKFFRVGLKVQYNFHW